MWTIPPAEESTVDIGQESGSQGLNENLDGMRLLTMALRRV
jgi:hypothetical protein